MPPNRSLGTLGAVLVLGLSLMALPEHHKEAVAVNTRSRLLTSGQWLFSAAIRYARHQAKSRFLLAQNVQLALENMRLREAAMENQRLRYALEFRRAEANRDLIAAAVIGRDPDQLYDTIVIDAGRNRGVQQDWPVITAAGLVGHVASVGASSSVVELLMRAPVSAIVQECRTQGIVSWLRGNYFHLRFVEAGSLVQTGAHVVSSGLGGRYPKGIPIGIVVEVQTQDRDPLFLEVILESMVDFLRLEEVFVMSPVHRW